MTANWVSFLSKKHRIPDFAVRNGERAREREIRNKTPTKKPVEKRPEDGFIVLFFFVFFSQFGRRTVAGGAARGATQ